MHFRFVLLVSKLVELASEMRRHSGTSVSELKRKYNHLVPSNERVLGLVESENHMSLLEVRSTLPSPTFFCICFHSSTSLEEYAIIKVVL